MKLCTNINRHKTICREQELLFQLHFLRNYAPLKFLLSKSYPLYNLNTIDNFDTIESIFMKLYTNINHNQMMCKKKRTPPTFFTELCPFDFFPMKIMSAL